MSKQVSKVNKPKSTTTKRAVNKSTKIMKKREAKVIDISRPIDIEFKHVSKTFFLCKNDFERLLLLLIPSKRKTRAKKALNDINFKIYQGDRVALIGHNGAGKSTIMHTMIKGVLPDKGSEIIINRKISTVIDVIGGLEDNFTGKENIYIKGAILGYSKKEISAVFDKIVEFAEIGPYIDQELRRYSFGMKCRLGFSININLNPEILLIDEALSVGDEKFNLKAKQALAELSKKQDTTIIIISHNNETIKELCNRGIYLNQGNIIYDGDLEEALRLYKKDNKDNQDGGPLNNLK